MKREGELGQKPLELPGFGDRLDRGQELRSKALQVATFMGKRRVCLDDELEIRRCLALHVSHDGGMGDAIISRVDLNSLEMLDIEVQHLSLFDSSGIVRADPIWKRVAGSANSYFSHMPHQRVGRRGAGGRSFC